MERVLNLRSLSALQERYNSLTLREQSVIIVGLVVVLAFLLVQVLYFPLSDKQKALESSIKMKEKDLLELKNIAAQYKRLRARGAGQKGKKQEEPFMLFSVLEKMATKSGLMAKMDYMRPGTIQLDSLRQEKWVELKLSRITLKELTSYLYNLQSFGKGIYIKRLSARKEGEYLNLILQPAVIEMK